MEQKSQNTECLRFRNHVEKMSVRLAEKVDVRPVGVIAHPADHPVDTVRHRVRPVAGVRAVAVLEPVVVCIVVAGK